MMLEKNPLFDASVVRSDGRVPSGLKSPAYWEIGKSSESVQCAMLKACDTCADMGQL